jgi:hypothetical protein
MNKGDCQADRRQSIEPTYDSAETGPRFHVSTFVDDRPVSFMEPIFDPFVRTTVTLGWRDLFRGLRQRRLTVVVNVGGHPAVCDDVLELDAQTLVPGSSRRDEFDLSLGASLVTFAASDPGPDNESCPS